MPFYEVEDPLKGTVRTIREVTDAHIREVLGLVKGDRSRAARLLGCSRENVRRWIRRTGWPACNR